MENSNYEGGEQADKPTPIVKKQRLISLDTFRGICLVIMIFVNYGGGGYWFFSHSRWHGLTVADLVMPWFMFMMGVSFTFSLKSLDRRGSSKRQMMMKVLLRCIKLFVIGLFLINQSDSWNGIRLPGVLQRFAICYLVGKHVHNRILIS